MPGNDFVFFQRVLVALVTTEKFGKLLPITHILGKSVDQLPVLTDRFFGLPFGKEFLCIREEFVFASQWIPLVG